jgi:hypothetical protein
MEAGHVHIKEILFDDWVVRYDQGHPSKPVHSYRSVHRPVNRYGLQKQKRALLVWQTIDLSYAGQATTLDLQAVQDPGLSQNLTRMGRQPSGFEILTEDEAVVTNPAWNTCRDSRAGSPKRKIFMKNTIIIGDRPYYIAGS